jgi:hypothetical protein
MQHAKVTALLAALVLTLGFAQDAHAQRRDNPWLIHVAGGAYFPVGEYANTANPGFGISADVGYQFNSRWYALGTFNLGWLKGDLGPDMRNYGYFLKAAYDIGDPGSQIRILVPFGAGAVTFDPETSGSEGVESTTKFALNAGLMFQYYVSPQVAISVNGMSTLVFGNVAGIGGDTIWIIPLTAGVLVRL